MYYIDFVFRFTNLFNFHISGIKDGYKIPLVYVLCSDKTTATYRRIFDELMILQPNFNPTNIVVDFELATVKAIREIFPNANIQGCYFHFKKNIIHQLGQHGLKARYQTDVLFAHEVRKLMALAFIPPDEVVQALEYFERNSQTMNVQAQKDDANIMGFVTKYFANHYIGRVNPKKKSRGNPQFALELWNVYESTLNGITLYLHALA